MASTKQLNALAASIVKHLDAVPEETREYRESLVYSLLSETKLTPPGTVVARGSIVRFDEPHAWKHDLEFHTRTIAGKLNIRHFLPDTVNGQRVDVTFTPVTDEPSM